MDKLLCYGCQHQNVCKYEDGYKKMKEKLENEYNNQTFSVEYKCSYYRAKDCVLSPKRVYGACDTVLFGSENDKGRC